MKLLSFSTSRDSFMANNDFSFKAATGKNPLKDKPNPSLESLSAIIEANTSDYTLLNSDLIQLDTFLEGITSLLPRYIEQLENNITLCNKEIEKIEEQRERYEEIRKRLSLMYEVIKGSENQ